MQYPLNILLISDPANVYVKSDFYQMTFLTVKYVYEENYLSFLIMLPITVSSGVLLIEIKWYQ